MKVPLRSAEYKISCYQTVWQHVIRTLVLIAFLPFAIGLCCKAELCLAQTKAANSQASPAKANNQSEPTLLWKNGDSLPGKMLKADSGNIRWQAGKLFRDPLDIDIRFLQQIDFPPATSKPAPDSPKEADSDSSADPATSQETTNFIVQTVDGMRLIGNVVRLDENRLLMSAPRFGEIGIARSRVASIQNAQNAGGWGSGRIDLDQWEANRGDKKQWKIDDLGHLVASRQNIHLYRSEELPKSALIEVEFRWNRKLDFVFGLAVPRSGRQSDSIPRLETWDDSLVFSHGDNFEVILESFKREDKRIKLLLHWDQEKKLVSIHDEQGTLMCQAELTGKERANKPGIFIENKTGDLTISNLLVRESQPGFDSTQPSFQLVGKAAQNGRVKSFDGKQWIIQTDSEKTEEGSEARKEQPIPAELLNNAFSINPSQAKEHSDLQILYADGMSVSGRLETFDGQQLQLKTNLSETLLHLSMDGTSKLVFNGPSPPEVDENQFVHELTSVAGTMRGRLEPGEQANSEILCWRLPGARQVVSFANADGRVIVAKEKQGTTNEDSWPDTLYFFNRDVVPCRLLAIDEHSIKFDSFTENRKIKPGLIKAIDMNSSSRSDQIDFDDSGWKFSANDKHKIVDQSLQISAGAVVSHSNLMSTGGFEFEMNWKGSQYGLLELKLLSDGRENSGAGLPQSLMFYEGNLYLQNAQNNQAIPVNGNKAKISFRLVGNRLSLFIDDKKVHSEKVQPKSIRGAGVSMQLSDPQNLKNLKLKLSAVRLLAPERNERVMIVDPQQKDLLLTIPRIKKISPPQHILRAANADMLRGEIVSLDENRIEFRAGQDTILFPRSLVTSLIWLHFKDLPKEQEASSDISDNKIPDDKEFKSTEADNQSGNQDSKSIDPERQTVQLLLQGNRRLTLELQAWSENKLMGRSEALGKCEIPFDQILELRFGTFANQAFDVPYSDWIAKLAPPPKMESGADGDSRIEMLFGTSSPLIGKSVNDVSIPMIAGKNFDLSKAEGKVVILDFWATWCGPCVKGLPDLIAATNEFSEDEVVFIGINQDEDKATIEAFQKTRNLDFQVGLGNTGLMSRFEANSLPKTIVIDPTGKIAFVKTGNSADQKAKLKKAIEHLLDSKARSQ